jgi:hypothetical protein
MRKEKGCMATQKAKSPELQFMEQHCKALKMSLKDLTVASLRSLFGHVYYIWRTFKPALGEKDGLKYYGNVWAALARISFGNAMKAFNLKEVKDLPTFGKIVQFCFTGVPALYLTRRNDSTEHVGHVLWCANPAYGPADNTYCRHEYYRQEVYLTYVYLWALIEEAKKAGLKEEVLVELPSGRCRDGSACACQIILRTQDANPDRPLPEIEDRFLDLEIGKQEPVLFILKKQKRTLEEQGPSSFIGFFAVDFLAWLQLNENVKNKATDVYLQLWRTFPPMWTKDAKLDLEIGKIKTARELASIISYCEKKKYVGYQVTSAIDGTVTLTAEMDPFVQVGGMLGAPPAYMQAIAKMDQDFVNNVLKEVKMDKKATATFSSHLAKGDKASELIIKVK